MLFSNSLTLLASTFLLLAPAAVNARLLMYYDQWHKDRPSSPTDRAGITHVVLAFAQANNTGAFQPVVPISTIRSEYPGAKVMIAIGGWGDTIGFSQAVKSEASMGQFGRDVKSLLESTGTDGIDIDWEYPGGNGADYKEVPNSAKVNEIPTFPIFLSTIRKAIGPDKLLTIAVPGLERDMMAFTHETAPKIWESVDFVNVMSYDLMNRRSNITSHHTSLVGSAQVIQNYIDLLLPPSKINLGFAFYAKYFTTLSGCGAQPLGCPVAVLEDPVTGADTGLSGAWTFEKAHMMAFDAASIAVGYDGLCGPEVMKKCGSGCCGQYGFCGTTKDHCSGGCQYSFGTGCTGPDVYGSWQRAMKLGTYDEVNGAQYYFDAKEKLWWTWDTTQVVQRKFEDIVGYFGLGGVMAWSLGEDSADWSHIRAMASGMERYKASRAAGRVDAVVPASTLVLPEEEEADLDTPVYVKAATAKAPYEDRVAAESYTEDVDDSVFVPEGGYDNFAEGYLPESAEEEAAEWIEDVEWEE